ncbi:hypothetical protein L917_19674 [Phytophthora nicotianae]|uniref:RxLR effector protein n=6 Tax=Phytophthora nicotianae TaxID=4792 RepID=V9E0T7_PHYNI|nr:hypothetical protein F443_20497 [Phytophthora nicotianae P1569]ETL79755.1 hypothetical protein L917_19674 [Phytophthora nicotianae]KUF83668.1 hypothetical protein AM587_10006713 [Phytophthora nicotianae]ETM32994.1 hypothetical protein L914_19714 [Phytophthora nicotianae]ETM32995.1 hypothetical protein L914_19713 [Phytophthora nicotianae]
MRLTNIFSVTIVAILHSGSTALPLITDPKTLVASDASTDVVALLQTNGGRLLRRVGYDDESEIEEERGFGEVKKAASKLNPVKAAKKTAKLKESIKEAAEHAAWLEKMRETIGKD